MKKMRLLFLSLMLSLLSWQVMAAPYVCLHKYALCISAVCDANGLCRCYVFHGLSFSWNTSCDDNKPSNNTVYSTYSFKLNNYNFKKQVCSNANQVANCMNAKCTISGGNASINGESVPVAMCQCSLKSVDEGHQRAMLSKNCNPNNCDGIRSTANPALIVGNQCPID